MFCLDAIAHAEQAADATLETRVPAERHATHIVVEAELSQHRQWAQSFFPRQLIDAGHDAARARLDELQA